MITDLRTGFRCFITRNLIGIALFLSIGFAAEVKAQEPVQAAHSGTYLTPGRDGEGWLVEVLNDTTALIIWFTFTPTDSDTGIQAWFGGIEGNRIIVNSANITSGAMFGPEFDPDDVIRTPWGSIEFAFDDDSSGTMMFNGLPEYGSGERQFVRLSGIVGLPFGVAPGNLPQPVPGQPGVSGTWVDFSHDGEGWFLQEVAPGLLVMAWFTFNDVGQQVWIIGTGVLRDGVAIFESVRIADGTDFGDAFDENAVNRTRWGEIRIVFTGCDSAILTYQSDFDEFGGGQLEPVRLTSLQNLNCTFPALADVAGASWRSTSNTGPALSSIAAARLDDAIYVAGGFGGGFFSEDQLWRYQPATNAWSRMQDMPDVRDLAAMAAFVTNFFDGAPMDNNWRYDPETNQWEVLTPMPTGRAAGGAAVVGDYIYVAGGTSRNTVSRYSPEEDTWEEIAITDASERTSCAVVAYRGEIWIMGGGGRELGSQPNNSQITIFDPVTKTARVGPAMNARRGGFAAAVVGGRVFAAGGQTLLPPQLMGSAEAYNPETDSWEMIAALPTPVQATAGTGLGGDFFVMLGSTEVDAVQNIGQAQVLGISSP